jgi:hypothetical protein
MHRRASVLFLGLFAVSAALQGAAACSNSDATTPPGADSGPPPNPDSSAADTAPPPTQGCTGLPPVMTVKGPSGDQIPGDWSCYAPDASFLFHPFPFDDAGDAGDEGGDAATDEGAAPVDTGVDAPPFIDANPPDTSTPDAAVPTDAGPYTFGLQLTDFLTGAPPVGATVDIIWGGSSLATPAYTGTADDAGIVLFPDPPQGQQLLTYHVTGAGEAPLYWLSVVIVPPQMGKATYNSLLATSLSNLLTSVLGSQAPNPKLAQIVTGAEDCQNRDVAGGQFVMIDTTTNTPITSSTTPGAPRTDYLYDNFPNPQCTYTTNVGGRAVWTMSNAPVDTTGRYKIQFLGRTDASHATPVVLAEYPVESYAGTVTVQRGGRLNPSPPN